MSDNFLESNIESQENILDDQNKSPFAFRTIGEAAKELDVEPHVLRFWESKFIEITPIKRRGRRYYSPQDIDILNKIKNLLYNKGFTIKGVKKHLLEAKKQPADLFSTREKSEEITANHAPKVENPQKNQLKAEEIISRLENIYNKLTNNN